MSMNDILPVGSIKPNSNKYKEKEAKSGDGVKNPAPIAIANISKEPLNKVGTSVAVVKGESFGEKLKDALIAEDPSVVLRDLAKERIVPELKDLAIDLLFEGLSIIFGTRRRSVNMASGKTNYAAISTGGGNVKYSYGGYKSQTPSGAVAAPKATSESPCEVLFKIGPDETWNDAKGTATEVLSNLRDAAIEYDHATVSDLYELSGITPKKFTDNSYGWTPDMLTLAVIRREREGYMLSLPAPIPVD